MRQCSDMTKSN